MSNTWAITAVTASLNHLLKRVANEVSGTSVTNEIPSKATEAGRRLNLFLYQVAPNTAYRNADLPFRNGNTDVVAQPVLALNLHYLLTAFGKNDDELDAHHVLAHAMSLVHDNGLLPRSLIRTAIGSLASFPDLAKSDLPDQIEPVKITPLELTTEDISKLWTAFSAPYRMSVAYEASLVLLERKRAVRAAPPVRSAGIYVLPLRRPEIESVSPQLARVGDTLAIEGRALASETVKLRFSVGDVVPSVIRDRGLEVDIPAGLRAGPNTVKVVHEALMGEPPAAHRGVESNLAVFVLVPEIETDLPRPPDPLREVVLPAAAANSTDFDLTVGPPVAREQRVQLLLGQNLVDRETPPPDELETQSVRFELSRALSPAPFASFPADLPVQVRVDGAESPVEYETTPGADFGKVVAPRVRVRIGP